MSRFFKIKQIQQKINSSSATMFVIFSYFFDYPTGKYSDFWKLVFDGQIVNDNNNIKHLISLLRKHNILIVNQEQDFYTFNTDPVIETQNLDLLLYGTQYKKAEEIICKKYNLDIKNDFSGVYYIYNKDREIIYIGSSIHIKQRIIEHYRCALWKKDPLYNTYKYQKFREIIENYSNLSYDTFPIEKYQLKDIKELRNLEKKYIQYYKPILNTKDKN